MVTFESLGTVSYSPSIVTMAVSVALCEIFSVKEWRDLENQVRGRSRSLKMAPFNRPHATFYWLDIVNIALSCTIFDLFSMTLNDPGFKVTLFFDAEYLRNSAKYRYSFNRILIGTYIRPTQQRHFE